MNIQESSDRKPVAKTRTSSIFPDFINCPGLPFLLFLHPTHGFLDRLEVFARLLGACAGLLLEAFKLGLESLEFFDGWDDIRRVSDEGGE
jgi:hypothetical protein